MAATGGEGSPATRETTAGAWAAPRPGPPVPVATAVPAVGTRMLVGREDEVRAFREALTGPPRPRGRALALVGEPGIGKSALMAAFTAAAADAALPVLSAHADGDEPLRPFKALLECGFHPPGHDAALPAASPGGLLAVVDDLHRLPPDTVPGIRELIRATAVHPVLLVVAYRERQLSFAMADALSGARSTGRLDMWRLGPLSLEQTRALLGDRPDLADIHRESGGNPQYIRAIAGDGHAGAEAATALLGEFAGLDRNALTAVQAAAALGEPFPPDLLAEVTGLEAADAMAALGTLTRADLVRPVHPAPYLALRHPVVGAVAYGRLDPGQRLALHRRAEAALARRGASIARRAPHVAKAADPNRPDHVATLIDMARECLHSAPRAAAGYLETAVRLIPVKGEFWDEARVLLARARLLTGDAEESRALLDSLGADLPDGALRMRAVADTSRAAQRLGRYAEAAAIARSGLASLPDQDGAAAAALHIELADAALDQRQYERAERHAGLAAAITHRSQDRAAEANALAQASLARLHMCDQTGARAAAAKAAELLDAAGDAGLLTNLQSLYQLGLTESLLGDLPEAERHLGRGAALSRRSGQTYILPAVLKALGEVQLRSGDIPRALSTLDEVASLPGHGASPATHAITLVLRAKALLWRGAEGDTHDALELAAQGAELAGSAPTAWAVVVRCLHAEIVLLTGDPQRGGWLLLEAVGGTGLPLLTTWRKPRWCDMLAEVAMLEGDRESAGQWARLAEESVARLPSPGRRGFARRALMRAHALHADTDKAVESAEQAVEGFYTGGKRVEVCRTLLAAASLSLDAGRERHVEGWLGRAASLADQCGSGRLADEAARERRRLTGPADHGRSSGLPAALSSRERQIADLTSTGMTSKEIARALFLSQRTIDTHLSNIYRKLGLPNRVALTRLMLGTGDRPDRRPQDGPSAPGHPGER